MHTLQNPQLTQESIQQRTVSVYVQNDVYFDIKKMERVTANVLGKLGCEGCHSGFDIRYISLREFVVNPKNLEVEAAAGPSRSMG